MRNKILLYANSVGADQTAHMRSLLSAFVIRCIDGMIAFSFMPL